MNWILEENNFNKGKIALNGSKFLIGNGYMGYRGTLDDFGKNELTACTLSGIYDQVGGGWREPVNAPNGLSTKVYCDEELLSILVTDDYEYSQQLDIQKAIHSSQITFKTRQGKQVTIRSERFLSLENVHLLCCQYSFKCSEACDMVINTGIDGHIWDINGPHLNNFNHSVKNGMILTNAETFEKGSCISVAEAIDFDFGTQTIVNAKPDITRVIKLAAEADREYCLTKYVAIFTSCDTASDVAESAAEACSNGQATGYDHHKKKHIDLWRKKWARADVQITGDEVSQFALRYSIYHLLAIAPNHTDRVSIPARGLSGQVYKGAIFWDTEMFMLPFFIYTNPQLARNLLVYRYHTLDGARRKASEYGYKGAFYAWESQDTGDDACTLFNVTDVYTGRPIRTYFRDRQIHVSADIVHGICQYLQSTGDDQFLIAFGAEIILECARFYYAYAYFKQEKNRYELLNVVGPDEYHERIDNNAYTNKMVHKTLKAALDTVKLLQDKYPEDYARLIEKLNYQEDLQNISDIYNRLYLPSPDPSSQVIEQFDRYLKLEDVTLDELRSRIGNPNEYLGGANGLAATTVILKQADVIMMLSALAEDYSTDIMKSNWEYYEPRTEHGSSLSPCAYSLVAAQIGKIDWAYEYFKKTATIDLNGDAKQYLGTIYIGGTHPAANGGAWMCAILGFGGVSLKDEMIVFQPRLPEKWESLAFSLTVKDQQFSYKITQTQLYITSVPENTAEMTFMIGGKSHICGIGAQIQVQYQ